MSRRGRRVQKASQRAVAGGGREVALAPQYSTSQGLNAQDEWFGPGQPMAPVAPPSVRGRRFDFQFGTNINVTPRANDWTSFEALRTLADRHDLTRMAIETAKDRMVRLSWGFRVLDSDEKLSPEQQARAKRLRTFFRRPDGKRFWVDWLRMILEDLLVIDAPAIYIRRTMDESEIVGLVQIDGATVKPVLDAWGNEPEAPETAFQQVLHGMPAVNYTASQLVYRPRNQRVHRVYGFSPVEQIISTINIALRRQIWQHSYFTDGNLPDSLIGVPSTWTPDQIRDFQDWFDGMLTGNTQRRRGGLFVPGEVAKSYVPTKEAEMFGAGEEWLARVVCFCFGIPHQALVKEVNRATADNAYEQAIEDGLAPIMGWVKSVMDGLLLDHFGETELEFWWVTDKPVDPKILDDIWKGRVEAGAANRNEWRRAVGMEPATEDEAEMLLYQGKPLGVADQIAQQQTRNDSGVFPSAIPGDGTDGEDRSSASGGADGEGDGEGDGSSSSSEPSDEGGAASKAAVPFDEELAGVVFCKGYNPSQPRNKDGEWTHGGGGRSKAPRLTETTNRDGSVTVYTNGKKTHRGTREEADAHIAQQRAAHGAPSHGVEGSAPTTSEVVKYSQKNSFEEGERLLSAANSGSPALTKSQQTALDRYTDHNYRGKSDYQKMNEGLRADSVPKGLQKTVADMDSAVASQSISEDMRVYRAIVHRSGDKSPSLEVGKSFTDKGYTSTSTHTHVAADFQANSAAGHSLVSIDLPKGQAGLAITKNRLPKGRAGGESEIVLPRGTKFEVYAKESVDLPNRGERVVWRLRIVP